MLNCKTLYIRHTRQPVFWTWETQVYYFNSNLSRQMSVDIFQRIWKSVVPEALNVFMMRRLTSGPPLLAIHTIIFMCTVILILCNQTWLVHLLVKWIPPSFDFGVDQPVKYRLVNGITNLIRSQQNWIENRDIFPMMTFGSFLEELMWATKTWFVLDLDYGLWYFWGDWGDKSPHPSWGRKI